MELLRPLAEVQEESECMKKWGIWFDRKTLRWQRADGSEVRFDDVDPWQESG